MKFIKLLFSLFWELPQILLGAIMYFVFKYNKKIISVSLENMHLFIETSDVGLSLGRIIYWTRISNDDCKMHEYGHAKQSKILGPLYLVTIGIPSMLRYMYGNWYYKKHATSWNGYYNKFPEKWADKLGGVSRNKSA